ncbi:hypothetical protein MAHJHV34_47120 [Mycobacterium avium subsp. hominissuis]
MPLNIIAIDPIIINGKNSENPTIGPERNPGWEKIRAIMPMNATPITAGKMICSFVRGIGRGAINGSSDVGVMILLPLTTPGGILRGPGVNRVVDTWSYPPCCRVCDPSAAAPLRESCTVIAAARDNSGPAGHT